MGLAALIERMQALLQRTQATDVLSLTDSNWFKRARNASHRRGHRGRRREAAGLCIGVGIQGLLARSRDSYASNRKVASFVNEDSKNMKW
jgi:hypothetical protein